MAAPIDLAFAILKMPYHGTSLANAQKIMEEGLKPHYGEYSIHHDAPPVSWATDDLGEAAEYAIDWSSLDDTPAIIHIPDEIEPFENWGDTYLYDKVIPPDQLSIHWQGEPYNPEQHDDEWAWRELNEELAQLNKSIMDLGGEPSPPPAMQMDWIDHDIMDAHPDKVFLFGDNHARRGFGGQARHMRGHPQAVGIRTKHSPSMHPSAMWTDDTYDDNVRMIDEDIQEALSHNKQIVIPSAGIGTGLARLSENAPDTFAYLQEQLQGLMGNSD